MNKIGGAVIGFCAGLATVLCASVVDFSGTTGFGISVSDYYTFDKPITVDTKIELGSLDTFSRPMIWNYNQDGVLVLGGWDADATNNNISSEGIVVYSSNTAGTLDVDEGAYARIKANRFGLTNKLTSNAEAIYLWRIDTGSMTFRNNSGTTVYEIDRTSGIPYVRRMTAAQIRLLDPVYVGGSVWNTDVNKMFYSTGTGVGQWAASDDYTVGP